MNPTYVAICTGMKRETHLPIPKMLLLDVQDSNGNLIREHMWVRVCKRLKKIAPQAHDKNKVKITFTGREEQYLSTEGGTKTTIKHLRNIKIIKDIK